MKELEGLFKINTARPSDLSLQYRDGISLSYAGLVDPSMYMPLLGLGTILNRLALLRNQSYLPSIFYDAEKPSKYEVKCETV